MKGNTMRLDRRRFLGTAAGAALAGAALPVAASATSSRQGAAATFHWLGTSGWRVDIGAKTLLVDPYLSRYPATATTPLTVDTRRIADHPGTPQTILVTHTHWDHFNDVPHIAKQSGARVFGTATAYNLGLAFKVPVEQLSPVKGGEVLDFGEYTVEVVASLHSRNPSYSITYPGVRLTPPAEPATVGDLPEGDTLAYQVTVRGGPSVFFMGASDFVERNLTGLAPDVAMVTVPATSVVHDYVPRLMAALDRPATVVPVHWDSLDGELTNPPTAPNQERLNAFLAAVRKVSPRTRVVVPEYLTPYTF
jgi:L-ascorbate metabolism protein UlaG (beta-lactamase superfamily)